MVKEMSTDRVHSKEHDKPDDSNATFFHSKSQMRASAPPGK